MLFCLARSRRQADRLAAEACELLGTDRLMGCTGESIVATGREIEEGPAMSLWAANGPA